MFRYTPTRTQLQYVVEPSCLCHLWVSMRIAYHVSYSVYRVAQYASSVGVRAYIAYTCVAHSERAHTAITQRLHTHPHMQRPHTQRPHTHYSDHTWEITSLTSAQDAYTQRPRSDHTYTATTHTQRISPISSATETALGQMAAITKRRRRERRSEPALTAPPRKGGGGNGWGVLAWSGGAPRFKRARVR